MIQWKCIVHYVIRFDTSNTKETKRTKRKPIIKELQILLHRSSTNLECLMTAALGNPVVPDVNM